MQPTTWNEKVEVISGLLDQQLAFIDAQLQSAAQAGAGQQAFADNDIRELCSLTRDLVATLPTPKLQWKILWRQHSATGAGTEDVPLCA